MDEQETRAAELAQDEQRAHAAELEHKIKEAIDTAAENGASVASVVSAVLASFVYVVGKVRPEDHEGVRDTCIGLLRDQKFEERAH
jgi:hypothetical protein